MNIGGAVSNHCVEFQLSNNITSLFPEHVDSTMVEIGTQVRGRSGHLTACASGACMFDDR